MLVGLVKKLAVHKFREQLSCIFQLFRKLQCAGTLASNRVIKLTLANRLFAR